MKRALLLCFFFSFISATPGFSASFFSQFIDPKDGAVDLSTWLSGRSGFLPVPIVISDPAVGYGGGLAAAFFHGTSDDLIDEETGTYGLPPSVSFVAGAYTENNSWLVAGGHLGNWKSDGIRYTGVAGYGDFNLKFFGLSDGSGLGSSPLRFNIQGFLLLQQILFRIKNSNFFIGGKYSFLEVDNDFNDPDDTSGIPENQLNSNTGGLGLVVHYDTRDNIISPSAGQFAKLEATWYNGVFISDFDYGKFGLTSITYWPVFSNKLIIGIRAEGELVTGDTPFYEVPYIEMRGIPALRYQGEKVIVGELELRWDFTYRWSLVGFVGSGWAVDDLQDFELNDAKMASGGGFRYLIARLYGLRVGVDIAVGPEDTVAYIGVGSSWN